MAATLTIPESLAAAIETMGVQARAASVWLARAQSGVKNGALREAARQMRTRQDAILEANRADIALATAGHLAAPLLDRLTLPPSGVEAMAASLEAIAELPDPVGNILASWDRPNGLRIERVSVPIGVIGIIYESRPNVTADAGGLCLKSGNAAILRGGSDCLGTSRIIVECLQYGLLQAGLPLHGIQIVDTADREAVGHMLRLDSHIDVIVPRGGKSLVERVMRESRVPVFAHLEGICHVYVDADADMEQARQIVVNAKLRRVSVCGAAETLLIDRAFLAEAKPILDALRDGGCEIRGDRVICESYPHAVAATEADWSTEYLDRIIAVAVVEGVAGAIVHINRHGSHHTDSIVTTDEAAAERFLNEVDSGIVLHNASTQFADGGEFGFGAEIGIATGKLHARGPVGAAQLTTYKYKVRGTGQTRP